MPLEPLIHTLHGRVRTLAGRLAFLAPALIRVTVGAVFIQTGWGHLTHLAETVAAFRDDFGVPFPELSARVASLTELVGGILILLGLGARLAALPMAFTMLVAIATAKRAQLEGFGLDGLTTLLGFEEWSYLVMFLVIALGGPGALSLDALIVRKRLASQLVEPGLQPAQPGEAGGGAERPGLPVRS
jgi:putative oxidoreductase